MKSIIAVIALAIASPAASETVDDMCAAYGSLANTAMQKRQEGVKMSVMMGAIRELEGISDWTREHTLKLIIKAYEAPLFTTPSIQARAVRNFANSAEVECYRAFQ